MKEKFHIDLMLCPNFRIQGQSRNDISETFQQVLNSGFQNVIHVY